MTKKRAAPLIEFETLTVREPTQLEDVEDIVLFTKLSTVT